VRPQRIVGARDRDRDAGDGQFQVDEREREIAQLQVALDLDDLLGPRHPLFGVDRLDRDAIGPVGQDRGVQPTQAGVDQVGQILARFGGDRVDRAGTDESSAVIVIV
jgi:hypothetical protein